MRTEEQGVVREMRWDGKVEGLNVDAHDIVGAAAFAAIAAFDAAAVYRCATVHVERCDGNR